MVELTSPGDIHHALTFQKAFGGDAFNTAIAASRLGSQVHFLTRLGKDPFADGLRQLLNEEGMDTRHIKTVPGYTGLYFSGTTPEGGREFVYYRKASAASTLCEDDIRPNLISQCQIVFSTGITMAVSPSARKAVVKAFKLAKQAELTTVFDPNFRKNLWKSTDEAIDALNEILPYVDVILPSVPNDTSHLIGFEDPELVIDYLWMKGVKLVVAKAGPDGCYVGYKKMIEHIPALHDVDVVDTLGAGDAFNGGFLHGLSQQRSLLDCAKLGIVTAGLKLQYPGALRGLPTREAVYERVPPEVIPV